MQVDISLTRNYRNHVFAHLKELIVLFFHCDRKVSKKSYLPVFLEPKKRKISPNLGKGNTRFPMSTLALELFTLSKVTKVWYETIICSSSCRGKRLKLNNTARQGFFSQQLSAVTSDIFLNSVPRSPNPILVDARNDTLHRRCV